MLAPRVVHIGPPADQRFLDGDVPAFRLVMDFLIIDQPLA
jgi:hypothetical protein